MLILALGSEKSLGDGQTAELRFVGSSIDGGVVPNSGPLDYGGERADDREAREQILAQMRERASSRNIVRK